MKDNKAISSLSIAMKAGRLVSGEFMTERAIRDKEAYLVVVADDASDGTKKKFKDSCTYYHVPIVITSDKESLGRAIGKHNRASMAVTDKGIANSILSKIAGEVS